MERFALEIDTTNDAFGDDPAPELGRLLRDVARHIQGDRIDGRILDANGNTVGSFGPAAADPVRDAAPELLAALKGLADAVSPGARGAPRSTGPVRAALETAAAAIAKAEGR